MGARPCLPLLPEESELELADPAPGCVNGTEVFQIRRVKARPSPGREAPYGQRVDANHRRCGPRRLGRSEQSILAMAPCRRMTAKILKTS